MVVGGRLFAGLMASYKMVRLRSESEIAAWLAGA
jgi:hypothetical protein